MEITGKLVRAIRRLRPQVVVTFDAQGGYGHPDHMTIHRCTVAAFEQAGDASRYPEHLEEGLSPHAPDRLYATTFVRRIMARAREVMRAEGGDLRPGGNAATIPFETMGASDDEISATLELTEEEFDTKLRAFACHRTQIRDDSVVRRLPTMALHEWLGTERFIRLHPSPGGPLAHDLFA